MARERAPRAHGTAPSSVVLMTAERVPLTVPRAGLGERALAYGIDAALVVALVIAVVFAANAFIDLGALSSSTQLFLVGGVLVFALAYDVLFETLGDGRTPGKRLLQIRVVTDGGERPDLLTSLLRNVFRLVDFMPGGYGVGTLVLFFTGSRRAGDIVAGTSVISERAVVDESRAFARALAQDAPHGLAALDEERAMQLLDTVRRTAHLTPTARRARLARAARGHATEAERALDDEALSRRAARTLVTALDDGRGVLGQVRRIDDAEDALARATSALTSSPTLDVIDAFDHAVRHAGGVLADARVRGVPPHFVGRLSLALLSAERLRRHAARASERPTRLFTAVPTAIYEERALVLLAALVLGGAAALGFVLAFFDDQVARALLGDDVASAVDAGARWTDRIEREGAFVETAVMVTLNNVRVGLVAFTAGLAFGIGTLAVVVMNGLHLGAVFGFAARLGTADTLLRFILAHGPVELASIAVAAAGGLVIGRALVSPGDRRRRDALREDGPRAFSLALGATAGFVVIGSVEGFVSPGATFSATSNAALGLLLLVLAVAVVVVFGGRARQAPSAASQAQRISSSTSASKGASASAPSPSASAR